ncbi:MAG: tetratricopeptide repeat protein [Planctomycetaceae bacterium]
MAIAAAPEKRPGKSIPASQRRKKWLFRGTAILLGLSIFPALELLLRLLDVGQNTSLVIPVDPASIANGEKFSHQFNGAADLAFYGQTDLSGPESRPFALPKPTRTLRIVVLGESTVIGFPYPSELSFPRHLELQLQRQMPERDVEVLNAGITGINSFAIAKLAAQCLQAEPDLIVVHAGHNEFYGPGGPGSTAFNLPPAVIRLAFAVRQWRTVQLFSGGYNKNPPQDDLLNILPQDLDIALGSAIYQQAKINYETNLREVVNLSADAGIPLLLTTVACNLRDQSPMFSGFHGTSRSAQTECADLVEKAAKKIDVGDFAAALALLQEGEKIVPDDANLHYRFGQCYHGQGKIDDAWKSFSRARDLDGCRFRIPSEFYPLTESVAAERDNCFFMDVPGEMRKAGVDPAPGHELFLEHVHYNFDGNYLLGKLIAAAVQTKCLGRKWDDAIVPDAAEARDLLGFLPEDDLAATSFAIRALETGPFSRTIDRKKQTEFLVDRAAKLFTALPELRRNIFADLPVEHMADDMLQHLLKSHKRSGDRDFCEVIERCQQKRSPWKYSKR